jgi:hypothetical protein
MESSIEAGDIGRIAGKSCRGRDAGQIVRLVQGREGDKCLQLLHDIGRDDDGGGETRSAMNDPMRDRPDLPGVVMAFYHVEHRPERSIVIAAGKRCGQVSVVPGKPGGDGGFPADIGDLAAEQNRSVSIMRISGIPEQPVEFRPGSAERCRSHLTVAFAMLLD